MKAERRATEKIIIDGNVCKGCHICIDQCPNDVFEVSHTRSAKGYLMPVVSRIDDCIACMLCELICPDLAITVEIFEDEK